MMNPLTLLANRRQNRARDPWEAVSPHVADLLRKTTRARPNVWGARIAAINQLVTVDAPPEDQELIDRTLRQVLEGRHRMPKRRSVIRGFVQPLLVTLPVGLLIGWAFAVDGTWPSAHLLEVCGVTLLATAGGEMLTVPFWLPYRLAADSMLENQVRAAAAKALGERKAISAAGTLADGTIDLSPGVRSAAIHALHQVLPQIDGTDTTLKNAETSYQLGRALYRADELLAVQILHALQKVGTSQAIQYVDYTMRAFPSGPVQELAQEVLATLQARQALDDGRVRLLRPSGETVSGAELLRAAGPSLAAEQELLLRPGLPEQ
jgi:hypothetical protein